ncbi:peptide deformylase [uncultured Tateyamaria sp.]|uniref:peptide deformylase n=1 Tax=uncultured Tateyamaria sp. TaxID=455651 RepID=UPI00260A123A|nr:peptide deformylase [uncultured Tateyamaria sp.]
MTLHPILTWPDARLGVISTPLETITDDVRVLAADMLETMYAAPGRGLSAPQIGQLLRMFVMDATWKDGTPSPTICINPEIISRSDDVSTGIEGCLSIPGVEAEVRRPASVRMVWTDLAGHVHEEDMTGFSARCAQHELDHLDGIMTLDRVDDDQRAALLARYEAR